MNGQNWRKATHSSENGGDCVEVGDGARSVLVRDTKERHLGSGRTVLTVPPAAWAELINSVR